MVSLRQPRSGDKRDRILIFAIKVLILLWGFVGVVVAGIDTGFSGGDSLASRTGVFVLLVYGSVEVCALIAFLSSRVAAALLGVCALSALALALLSQSSGQPLSDPSSWLTAIAIRPALCALLLYAVSRGEKRA